MKLSRVFDAVAYKQLTAADLEIFGSHQYELKGINALKSVFGTATETRGSLTWLYFPTEGKPSKTESSFTFYDARSGRASASGRSEWRLYFKDSPIQHANAGDLIIIAKTSKKHWIALILQRGSAAYTEANSSLGLQTTTLFDSIPEVILANREWTKQSGSVIIPWLDIPEDTEEPSNNNLSNPLAKELDEEESRLEPVEFDGNGMRRGDLSFKPRARMLTLLGDQLIRDAGIAVFELVKNAYDADATEVDVTLSHVTDKEKGLIIIEDNGHGMNWNQIVNVWLEPGTDYRQKQKQSGYRTPKFNRLPLGEKGVGRFAAQKLGRLITVITKQKHSPEVVVSIDWDAFLTRKYLSGALVSVKEREPQHFTNNSTGTRIEISTLNEEISRGIVRQIHRSINSITSPFRGPADFSARLEILPLDNSLSGLLDVGKVLDLAPYRATCLIEESSLTYDYDFDPPAGLGRVKGRSIESKKMEIPPGESLSSFVGPILFEIRIFDLDAQILQYSVTDKKGFKDFLRNSGGVRVYRDGVRIYDYGEPGNDWLDLGGSRVNQPASRVSNNQIIGAIHLDGQQSSKLIEKTNREGFIEDEVYLTFRNSILFALTQIVFERNQDKQQLRALYSDKKTQQPVLDELSNLRQALKQLSVDSHELLSIVDDVEKQYIEMRDTLMTAAGAGLTLTIVIHEVEKAIKGLILAVERETPIAELRDLTSHLDELIEGLTYLTRKTGRKNELFSTLIKQAIINTKYRTRSHQIEVIDGTDNGNPDINIQCTRRLIIATLMNLIDNSIFWLGTKKLGDRRIYIGTSQDIPGGPIIFVADSGPGFQDAPENLAQPFMTRRPEGTGLGLHVADLIMKSHNGRLIFPSREDIDLPPAYSGAIVGLQFTTL